MSTYCRRTVDFDAACLDRRAAHRRRLRRRRPGGHHRGDAPPAAAAGDRPRARRRPARPHRRHRRRHRLARCRHRSPRAARRRCRRSRPRPAPFVVATIRPDYGALPGDADRWLELCEIAEITRLRAPRVVRPQRRRRLVSARPARRTAALAVTVTAADRAVSVGRRAGRRCAGLSRKSGSAQPPHELAAVDLLGACGHHRSRMLLWHVVVVALEAAARYPHRCREVVQLLQRLVRHQMAPPPAAPPPARLVDEHGHGSQPRTRAGAGSRPRLARCLVAPRPPPGDTDRR